MSLIEILAVLAIISVVIAIGIPAFGGFRHTLALESQANELVSLLREHQAEALKTQILQTSQLTQIPFENGVLLQSSSFASDTITWNSQGIPSQAGTITLIAPNNATQTITIKSSGFIKTD